MFVDAAGFAQQTNFFSRIDEASATYDTHATHAHAQARTHTHARRSATRKSLSLALVSLLLVDHKIHGVGTGIDWQFGGSRESQLSRRRSANFIYASNANLGRANSVIDNEHCDRPPTPRSLRRGGLSLPARNWPREPLADPR